ncbi:MAG: hypothetical protein F6K22_01110 [Okeania sp. SIO2F4]|uniref:hypothetical protein n=1 Tax=Okeania sp. SIO2F4 TaxID=2607790 RepID=UPI001429A3C1|nr:hypothetical protein [Okeania sp. SIO2F4]NES01558.1 hypothetical protein [Okeania sp. SIO2F4]
MAIVAFLMGQFEVRSQKSEVRSYLKSKVRSQKSEVRKCHSWKNTCNILDVSVY